MKTNALIAILIIVALASCTPAEQIKSTEIPATTATLTFTPNPTSTSTPMATSTLKPTAIPSPTPDYSTLGNPPEKKDFAYPGWLPRDYFAYDNENYIVFSKVLHGTEVIVAVHKDNNQPTPYHKKFAEFIWATFHLNWEVFQGYPYKTYYVKVLSPTSNQSWVSSTAIGFTVATNPQKSNIGSSWYANPDEYRQFVTHEMFHAWNGNIIMDVGNHINYVVPEFWFHEGATHYYGYRGTPNDILFYNRRFSTSWQRYQDWLGTDYDVPVIDLSRMDVTTGEWQYGQNVREKGACLFYLLDRELISMGFSLDDLMRYMYENFGLKGKRYSTNDILDALNIVTDNDWSEFFDKYVYGTEPLPLDGKFIYLEH